MNEKTSAFLCCFAVFVWTTSAESGNMRTTKGQEYNKHSKWTECTVPCGGGYSYRIRECKDLSGDPDCEKSEKKRCNTNPCEQKPNIQDKAYTEYSEWSQCSASCGGGLSFRVRECDKLSGDVDCEESESKSCNEQPCHSVSRMEYTEYGNWSACTASCGGGFTFRIRECEDLSGDPDCEESERKSCNEQPCEPNGGLQSIEERSLLPPSFSTLASTESASSKYHEYGDWSPCTVTCGNGFSFRVKECKDLSGDPDCEKSERKECNERSCDEDLSNNTEKPIVSKEIPSELESQREDLIGERSLVLHTLPPVATSESENDKYVEYVEWSPCTAPCGGGFTFRVKECKDLSGDPDCEKSEKRRCNEQSCDPAPTKEKYEEYSPWTRCTVTCGGGYTFRTRECSDLTGDPGCEDTGKKKCNMQPCETEKETKVAGDKEKDLIGDSSLLIFTTPPTPPTKTERTTNENSVTGEIDGENLVERLKLVIEEPADFSNISEGFVEGRDIGIPTVVQTTMAILPTATRVHESSTTPTDGKDPMTSIPMTATTQMITQPLSTGTSRQEVIRNCGIRQLTPLGSFLELNAPRFKNGQRYDCAWTITVPENDTIFAVVYYFNTVECCDVLKVLDGSETVALFNGNFTNEQEFITKTNTISLQFKSDGGSGARRFRIRYTIRSLLTVLPTNIPDRVTPTSPSKIDGTPTATLSRLTSAPIVQGELVLTISHPKENITAILQHMFSHILIQSAQRKQ